MSPTVLIFHTNYWEFSDTVVPPVHISGGWSYPQWQAAVITPSLFGMIGAWIDTKVAQFKWHWALHQRIVALDHERRLVLLKTLSALESPAYPLAQTAVRGTATTLGFNRPEAWKGLNRVMKDSPGKTENIFRHMEACRRLQDAARAAGSTLTNPQQNFVTELAYQGFAMVGR